jgi:hypothetical protein
MPQFKVSGGQIGGSDPGPTGGSDPGPTGGSDPGPTGGSDPGPTGGSDPGPTGGRGARQAMVVQKAVTDLGPAVIAQRRLTFKIQHQEQTEWCWAAVAASVQQYFEPATEPALELKQCAIADMVLHTNLCCPYPEFCNQPAALETALKKIHKWRKSLNPDPLTGPGTLTFAEVQREIDRGRPVCVGIRWYQGGGHFVVIRGYRVLASGAQQLYIADPDNPSNLVDFYEFTNAYYGEGTWNSTDLVVNDWS